MQKILSASHARADIYNLIDLAAKTHEPIIITGKRNNAVLISQEDWSAIEETLYLNSIKGLSTALQKSLNTPDSEFSEDIQW